jgi:hypothetical protein
VIKNKKDDDGINSNLPVKRISKREKNWIKDVFRNKKFAMIKQNKQIVRIKMEGRIEQSKGRE